MSITADNYDHRLRAVEDAIRLVRTMNGPTRTANVGMYTSSTVPLLDRFDVLEVARFLLDEEGDLLPAAVVECSTCGGAGEIVQCANDGTHRCSHANDRTWKCATCDGTGEVAS